MWIYGYAAFVTIGFFLTIVYIDRSTKAGNNYSKELTRELSRANETINRASTIVRGITEQLATNDSTLSGVIERLEKIAEQVQVLEDCLSSSNTNSNSNDSSSTK